MQSQEEQEATRTGAELLALQVEGGATGQGLQCLQRQEELSLEHLEQNLKVP